MIHDRIFFKISQRIWDRDLIGGVKEYNDFKKFEEYIKKILI